MSVVKKMKNTCRTIMTKHIDADMVKNQKIDLRECVRLIPGAKDSTGHTSNQGLERVLPQLLAL